VWITHRWVGIGAAAFTPTRQAMLPPRWEGEELAEKGTAEPRPGQASREQTAARKVGGATVRPAIPRSGSQNGLELAALHRCTYSAAQRVSTEAIGELGKQAPSLVPCLDVGLYGSCQKKKDPGFSYSASLLLVSASPRLALPCLVLLCSAPPAHHPRGPLLSNEPQATARDVTQGFNKLRGRKEGPAG
jgi:hypothetical protein